MISTLVTPSPFTYKFPSLMESNTEPGFIVLFSGHTTGTIVALPPGYEIPADIGIGYHQDNWDIHCFTLFGGNIDLCNEATGGFDEDDEDDKQDPCEDCTEQGCAMQVGENHALGDLASRVGQNEAATQQEAAITGEAVTTITLNEILARIMASAKAPGAARG